MLLGMSQTHYINWLSVYYVLRALAQTKYTLPNHKQIEYSEIVRDFYQVDELDDELIQKASKIDPK